MVARAAVQQLHRGAPLSGDYQVEDDSGRTWEVTLIDGVILTYWIDHAVCEVKVGLIEWVE